MDNVVTNESAVIAEMVRKISMMLQNNLSSMEKWVTGEKLMIILGISKRGLQNYLDTKQIQVNYEQIE